VIVGRDVLLLLVMMVVVVEVECYECRGHFVWGEVSVISIIGIGIGIGRSVKCGGGTLVRGWWGRRGRCGWRWDGDGDGRGVGGYCGCHFVILLCCAGAPSVGLIDPCFASASAMKLSVPMDYCVIDMYGNPRMSDLVILLLLRREKGVLGHK